MKFNIQLFAPQPSAPVAIIIDDVEVVFNSGFNQFASDIDEIPNNEDFSYDSTTHYVKYQNKVLYDKITGAHVLSTDDPWDYNSTSGDPLITATTYKHLTTSDNKKIQVDSAIRDGNGKKIDTNYQTKLPTTSTAGKVLKSTNTEGMFEWGDAGTTVTSVDNLTGGTITSATNVKGTFSVKNANSETVCSIDQNGDITGRYLKGTLLYTSAATDNSSWTDVFVNNAGWLYKRSKADIKTDLGIVPVETTVSTAGAVSQTMSPNTCYNFTGALTSLTLTLGNPGTARNYYKCKFYSGNTPVIVNIIPYSGNIRWTTGASLGCLEPDTYYILEIEDNVATLNAISNNYLLLPTTYLYGNTYYTSPSNDGGTITLTDITTSSEVSEKLSVGHTVSVTATPNTNFTLYSLKVNGVDLANNGSITPQSDISIEVYFKGDNTTFTYTAPESVTITLTCNGSTITSGATVKYADVINVLATYPSGYTNLQVNATNLDKLSSSSDTNNRTYNGQFKVTAADPNLTFTITEPTS